jgi:hypothetical protein
LIGALTKLVGDIQEGSRVERRHSKCG